MLTIKIILKHICAQSNPQIINLDILQFQNNVIVLFLFPGARFENDPPIYIFCNIVIENK